MATITTLSIGTTGRGLTDITDEVSSALRHANVSDGLLTLFVQHTSASLVIQENADPAVCRDLEAFFRAVVPEDSDLWTHTAEGPDDMPAHVRSALTQTSLAIPIQAGRMMLGTWQGIYLWEHRRRGATRRVVVHIG